MDRRTKKQNKTNLMKLKFKAALLVAVAALSSVASAITEDFLQNLVDSDGSLTIGDKTFSGFDYTADGLNGFNAANIKVKASILGDVYFLTWSGNISVASLGLATGDLALFYTVTASAGVITEIGQKYTGGVSNGIGAISVAETVSAGATLVANSNLSVGDLSDPFAEAGDDLEINPGESVLQVVKDIALAISANEGELGLVSLSEVSQSFQQENRVPDGGSAVALLGIALVGLQGLRRKMR